MNNKFISTVMDLSLLFFLLLVVITIVFVGTSADPFFKNLISLLITLLLVVVTYFTGIVPGMIFSLIFAFSQIAYVSYQYIYHKEFSYGSLFWLVAPPLFCISIYLITHQVRLITEENRTLVHDTVRLNTLDADTNLRTLNMYSADFQMLSDASQRFDLPLYTAVIRIRHWDGLKRLMNEEQIKELLKVTSTVIKRTASEQNLLYIVDRNTPTWSLLLYSDNSSLKIFKGELKERFKEEVEHSIKLANLNIELIFAQVMYEAKEETTGTDVLAEAIHALQYDV